jgi:hypothetical protein
MIGIIVLVGVAVGGTGVSVAVLVGLVGRGVEVLITGTGVEVG